MVYVFYFHGQLEFCQIKNAVITGYLHFFIFEEEEAVLRCRSPCW